MLLSLLAAERIQKMSAAKAFVLKPFKPWTCLFDVVVDSECHGYIRSPENRMLLKWMCVRISDCNQCFTNLKPYYGVDDYAKIREARKKRKETD